MFARCGSVPSGDFRRTKETSVSCAAGLFQVAPFVGANVERRWQRCRRTCMSLSWDLAQARMRAVTAKASEPS